MVDIDELINKINKRMTPKEAYELNKTVCKILQSDKYSNNDKIKLKCEALLEPLAMLASCYENDTQ